jgi:hypothetical protein
MKLGEDVSETKEPPVNNQVEIVSEQPAILPKRFMMRKRGADQ